MQAHTPNVVSSCSSDIASAICEGRAAAQLPGPICSISAATCSSSHGPQPHADQMDHAWSHVDHAKHSTFSKINHMQHLESLAFIHTCHNKSTALAVACRLPCTWLTYMAVCSPCTSLGASVLTSSIHVHRPWNQA